MPEILRSHFCSKFNYYFYVENSSTRSIFRIIVAIIEVDSNNVIHAYFWNSNIIKASDTVEICIFWVVYFYLTCISFPVKRGFPPKISYY